METVICPVSKTELKSVHIVGYGVVLAAMSLFGAYLSVSSGII